MSGECTIYAELYGHIPRQPRSHQAASTSYTDPFPLPHHPPSQPPEPPSFSRLSVCLISTSSSSLSRRSASSAARSRFSNARRSMSLSCSSAANLAAASFWCFIWPYHQEPPTTATTVRPCMRTRTRSQLFSEALSRRRSFAPATMSEAVVRPATGTRVWSLECGGGR